MPKKKFKNIFPKARSIGKRDWGKEDLLVLIPKLLSLKLLLIKKGKEEVCNITIKKMNVGI